MGEYQELVGMSAVTLRRMIGNRQLSPVELVDACIARIEAVDPFVNAMAATDFDAGREAARAAENAVMRGEPLGLLHGLPTGVKDLEATAGLLTTHGSPLYRDAVPHEDNLLVARLRAAGAIVVGKTNVPELGAGANTRNPVWGATGNPFNPNLNAGGSSGGSAAALACDMLPVCTGSDTGGSLRIPAALCGVVGFRPSPGLVPSPRKLLGWTPISVVGPMGRSVADARLQLAATVGVDSGDPLSYPVRASAFLAPRTVDLSTLRVGWTEDFGVCAVDDEIRKTFRAKLDAMHPLFGTCEEISVDFGDAHRAFDVIRADSFVAGLRDAYEADPASLGPNTRANYELGAAMTLADAAWAHREQTGIMRRFQELYSRYDVILSPTTPVSPFPWTTLYASRVGGEVQANYYRWLALTYVVTLCTNPAITLPCGLDDAGMPFGLQVTGPFRRDRWTLDIAEALEAAFAPSPALCRPRPDLTKLSNTVIEPALKSIVTAPPAVAAKAARDNPGTSLV
ncbi:amidase [Paraburkholderia tropica]|uniref:Asp-tRNAAsn/Glu-tRNAGln amidotransferase A subunit n=1 Tax=Paraburkholderia tropica TaxID=92647 RepID=A0AAQ1JYN3_9BURK|nr:amidase family protein [Paraburkholderia tropica]RQN33892.1 amidase [Paraburkholderia tropica]SEK15512.1 Asp-tRNAAsn/Glu-tRNAGln amidotransferase A subunit [Paraburkholderia tropica]